MPVQSLQTEALRLLEEGHHAESAAKCKQALESFDDSYPRPSARAAFVLCSLGFILEQTGVYAEAEACAARALAMLESLPPASVGPAIDLLRLRSFSLLGTALRQLGEYAKAEAPFLRAIEIAEGLPDRPDEAAGAWNNLGMLCKYAGWFDRGEQAYARALEAAARQAPHRKQITATILHNIGGILHARGHFDRAEEPARQAWEIRRELTGDDHPSTLADAAAYAAVLDGLGRYKESKPMYQHALAIYERVFGPEHYETAATLHNLALVEESEGNLARAVEMARRSLDIKTRLFGRDHPDAALSAMNLASLLIGNSTEEARALLDSALRTFERALAADHPHAALCRRLRDRAQA
jgi:tetratricopeptide (TPR) repeat protein